MAHPIAVHVDTNAPRVWASLHAVLVPNTDKPKSVLLLSRSLSARKPLLHSFSLLLFTAGKRERKE